MRCREVMSKNIQFVREDDDIRDAARKMRDADIGFLAVCDSETNRLVGTLTERDIIIRMAAQGRTPDAPVEEIMSTAPLFCHADDHLAEARSLMESHQVSRMIVLDENNQLAGVISLTAIASQDTSDDSPRQIKQP